MAVYLICYNVIGSRLQGLLIRLHAIIPVLRVFDAGSWPVSFSACRFERIVDLIFQYRYMACFFQEKSGVPIKALR